jgi:hypothetical protein
MGNDVSTVPSSAEVPSDCKRADFSFAAGLSAYESTVWQRYAPA